VVAAGAGLLILLRAADRLIGLLSFSITARLLQRDDFGVFALAVSILAVVELFTQAGVDTALIQHRTFDRRLYNTAWTLNILLEAVVAIVLCAAAVPVSRFFDAPSVEVILYWLALATLIAGFENVGTVDFLKTLDFRREVMLRLGVRVVATAVALSLAFAWRDYRALVAGYVASKVCLVILSFVMHPFRPRPSLGAFRRLFGFTKWMLARNVLQELNNYAAPLIVGRLVNVGALAYFSLARELAGVATTDLQAPIRRALFPGYAAMNDNPPALKRAYLDSVAMMVLLGLPIPVGLAVAASEVVRVVFGERWLAAAPLLQILALSGIVSAMSAGVQPVLLAIGRPESATKLAALRLAVLLPCLAVGGTVAGVHGVAWAMVTAAAVMWIFDWGLVRRALLLSMTEIWHGLHRPLVAAAIMTAVMWALLAVLPTNGGFGAAFVRLATVTPIGAAAYVACLLIAWRVAGRPPGAEQHVIEGLIRVQARFRLAPGFERTTR
jgi:O-antigen/teichoic acid export membrane protein